MPHMACGAPFSPFASSIGHRQFFATQFDALWPHWKPPVVLTGGLSEGCRDLNRSDQLAVGCHPLRLTTRLKRGPCRGSSGLLSAPQPQPVDFVIFPEGGKENSGARASQSLCAFFGRNQLSATAAFPITLDAIASLWSCCNGVRMRSAAVRASQSARNFVDVRHG